MDNLTHTLIGVGLANAGISRRAGKGTAVVLALTSNLPDVDIFYAMLAGGPSFACRRMLTHSIFALLPLAAAAAIVLRPFFKSLSWTTLFALSALGIAGHVLFDLMNSYGVVLLYPFSTRRYELAWLFIIDLAIWAILAAPLFVPLVRARWRDAAGVSSMVALAVYVAFCGLGRWRSGNLLAAAAAERNARPEFLYVFPEALGPHRFRGVWKANGTYQMFQIKPWSGTLDLRGVYPSDDAAPAVAAARATPLGRKLDWFFRAPVWTAREDGSAEVFDLRFVSTTLNWRKAPFTYRIPPAR